MLVKIVLAFVECAAGWGVQSSVKSTTACLRKIAEQSWAPEPIEGFGSICLDGHILRHESFDISDHPVHTRAIKFGEFPMCGRVADIYP